MVREEFENYGVRATQRMLPTELAGRYQSQVQDERRILVDILKKLEIGPDNRLLEIGCGPGQILIPLSFLVSEATGVDHPRVCSVFEERFQSENLTLIPGDFMDIRFGSNTFDRILCYSVLQYLANEKELISFVKKALTLLRPGGQMLIGDLPNIDKKNRFLNSESGKVFDEKWRKKNLSESSASDVHRAEDLVEINDKLISGIIMTLREDGFHSYVLPQDEDLPFGRSREDLLVIRAR